MWNSGAKRLKFLSLKPRCVTYTTTHNSTTQKHSLLPNSDVNSLQIYGRQAVLQQEHRVVDCKLKMQRSLSKNICKFRKQSRNSQRLVVYILLTGQMTKAEVLSYPMLAGFRKGITLWKVSRLRPFVLVTATCGCIRLWSIGEIILRGES